MTELHWDHPAALYALWCVLPLAGLLVYAQRRRTRALKRLLDKPMERRLVPVTGAARPVVRGTLFVMAFVFLVVAAARPRWGVYFQEVQQRGSDILVALDVSRSMLSRDVAPNRLERAKSDIRDFLDRVGGDRIGLVLFAGRPVLACPLTTDRGFFLAVLDEAGPQSATRGGTALGDAIREGLRGFGDSTGRDRSLLLITDGEDHDSFPKEAAALAAERGVRVFAVGMGDTVEGARIPVVDERGNRVFVKYEGKEIWSRMDESLLKEIALKTGGAYVPARTRAYDLGEIYEKHLSGLMAGEGAAEKRLRLRDRFQIFLLLGLLCLLAELFLRASVKPSPFSPRLAAAMLLLALSGSAQADDAAALVKRGVARFGEGDAESAARLFEEAQELAPKDPTVAFDRGVALQRLGNRDDARAHYLLAAVRNGDVALSARFNLGTLAVDEAREALGEAPEATSGEARGDGMAALDRAIRHFRACLELDAAHTDARRNLEILLRYREHLRTAWEKEDEQKPKEQEPDLLSVLKELMKRQRELRLATRALLDEEAPAARSTAQAPQQEQLAVDAAELPGKIAQALQQPGPQGQPPSPEQQQGAQMLQRWAQQAVKTMRDAHGQLVSGQALPAEAMQKQAYDILERVWNALAPLEQVVSRGIQLQAPVVEHLKPFAANEAEGEELPLDTEDEARVHSLARLLSPKARSGLEQLAARPPVPEAVPGETCEQKRAREQEAARRKALERAYVKALSLAPQAVQHAAAATRKLQEELPRDALPDAEEVLRLLREIAEELPKEPPQKRGQDPKEDDEREQEGKQQEEKQKEREKEKEKDRERKPMTPEQAEATMRKAEEREREHKERLKERARLAAGAGKAERDW